MSRFIFLLAILSLLLACNNPSVDKTDPLLASITSNEAKEDFDFFTRILKKAHPSFDDKDTELKMTVLLDSLFKTIPDNDLTMREFYNKIAFAIDEIGCSHSIAYFPTHMYDTMDNRELFFPYPVAFIEGSLVINITDDQFDAGTKILSINKKSANAVLNELMMYNTVDGEHRETQRYLAASDFGFDYFVRFGGFREFELRVRDTLDRVKTVFVNGITMSELARRKQQLYYFDANDVPYSLRINEEKDYGLLRLTSFEFDTENQESAFEAFLENSFDLLRYKKNINTLIIDLRLNRGGTLYYCYLLNAYLSEKPFAESSGLFSRIGSVPYKNSLSPLIDVNIGDINDRLRNQFISHSARGYIAPDSMLERWEPKENRFTGTVYIITNADVASAASYFTTLVKNSGRGKVIGVETCGSEHASNGYSLLKYRLPASEIDIEFPYVRITYSHHGPKSGRGLVPDHLVPDTYESFRKNEDRQLIFITDSLISKKR